MRAVDMTVGEKYVTNRGRVVTYLATPDDVRSQRRVRVRFEDGISRGNERDLPTRSIARPRTPSPTRPAPKRIKPQPSSTIVELARPPRVGDTVIIGHVTGELRWIVDAIDAERGVATISAKIFGQPQTRSALIDALVVCQEHRTSARNVIALPSVTPPAAPPVLARPAPKPRTSSAPRQLNKPTDVFMDRLLFSESCLHDAKLRLGLTGRDPADQLRQEVRRDGVLVKRGHGEYIRVRVPGRFDIVLIGRTEEGELVDVERLNYPTPKERGKRRGSSPRHRRAA